MDEWISTSSQVTQGGKGGASIGEPKRTTPPSAPNFGLVWVMHADYPVLLPDIQCTPHFFAPMESELQLGDTGNFGWRSVGLKSLADLHPIQCGVESVRGPSLSLG